MPRLKKNSNNQTIQNTQQVLDNREQIAALLRTTGALFDTLDLEVYKDRLNQFSGNELNNEALRVGLRGGQDRTNTTRAILEIFNQYRSQFVPNVAGYTLPIDLPEDKKKIALELMKDGK